MGESGPVPPVNAIHSCLFSTPSPNYLESVQEGTLASVWAGIVRHFLPANALVVDLTYRDGRMWTGYRNARVIALDRDQGEGGVDAFADCRHPPLRPLVADAVVFDAPWGDEAGRSGYAGPEHDAKFTRVEHVLALIRPEAWARIVRPDGYLFVRCADYRHAGQFVDLATELIVALTKAPPAPRTKAPPAPAWDLWDRVIHVTRGRTTRCPMPHPPKTKKAHSYFLVFRHRRPMRGPVDLGAAVDPIAAPQEEILWHDDV